MPEKILSLEVEVVGMSYRGWTKQGRVMLRDRAPFAVTIEREPQNEYDPNAILVKLLKMEIKPEELGYIRRETAVLLAPRLDAGRLIFKSGLSTDVDIDAGLVACTLRFADRSKQA
jgi:hypothetical protein